MDCEESIGAREGEDDVVMLDGGRLTMAKCASISEPILATRRNLKYCALFGDMGIVEQWEEGAESGDERSVRIPGGY